MLCIKVVHFEREKTKGMGGNSQFKNMVLLFPFRFLWYSFADHTINFNFAGGPQAMLQGASTYAGFTYILDQVFGSETNTKRDREFEFTDTPVDERGY